MATPIDIESLQLHSGERPVPAADSILQLIESGDVDAAVRWYEEGSGLVRDAVLQRAESAGFETRKAIAQMLSRARDFGAAATVYKLLGLDTEAARLFEQAQDFASAAECWAKTGEVLKAAASYERAGKLDPRAASRG